MGLQGCREAFVEALQFLDLEKGILPRRSRRNTKVKMDKERFLCFLVRNKDFIFLRVLRVLRVLRGERSFVLRGEGICVGDSY